MRSDALEALEPEGHFQLLIYVDLLIFDDDSTAPFPRQRPATTQTSFTTPSFGCSQLVLHLHRFDDNDGLARGDAIADGDEHPHDASRHGRLDDVPDAIHRRAATRLRALSLPPRDNGLVQLCHRSPRHSAAVAAGMKANLARGAAIDERQRIGIDPRRVNLAALALDRDGERCPPAAPARSRPSRDGRSR